MKYKNIILMHDDMFYDIDNKTIIIRKAKSAMKGMYITNNNITIPNLHDLIHSTNIINIHYNIEGQSENTYNKYINVKLQSMLPYEYLSGRTIKHIPSLINLEDIVLTEINHKQSYGDGSEKYKHNTIEMLKRIANNIPIKVANSYEEIYAFDYLKSNSSITSSYINDNRIITADNGDTWHIHNLPLSLIKIKGEYFLLVELTNYTDYNRTNDILYYICKSNNINVSDMDIPTHIKTKEEKILILRVPSRKPGDEEIIIKPTVDNIDNLQTILKEAEKD